MTRRRWPGWLGRRKVGSCQFGSNLVLRKMVFIAPGFRFIFALVSYSKCDLKGKCANFLSLSGCADFLTKVDQNFKEFAGEVKIIKAMKAAFREETIPDITKLQQQIVLTIMNLEHPDKAKQVSTEANIPLLGFETPNEVLSYLDAVIRSGTSTEQKNGTVFLMGNTAHCLLN